MGSTRAKTKEEAQAAAPEEAAVQKKPKGRKRVKKHVPIGVVHVHASFNNTLITVTDPAGNTLSWSSAGSKGFRGSRKSTPYAAQVAAEDASRKAMDSGVRTVSVVVKGPGAGREAALRAISSAGIRVTGIQDATPIPHNGCRPSKRRRV